MRHGPSYQVTRTTIGHGEVQEGWVDGSKEESRQLAQISRSSCVHKLRNPWTDGGASCAWKGGENDDGDGWREVNSKEVKRDKTRISKEEGKSKTRRTGRAKTRSECSQVD